MVRGLAEGTWMILLPSSCSLQCRIVSIVTVSMRLSTRVMFRIMVKVRIEMDEGYVQDHGEGLTLTLTLMFTIMVKVRIEVRTVSQGPA